ncbi:MAG: pyruvate formate-lyase, partial [Clostridia bacterium]|nr:pyruvate formate-lyase [Clostridia bacterium]
RGACEPMANGNNPMGGRDKSGPTAMLNSLTKLDPSLHAGAVQNMKFTTEMFNKYREKTKALLTAYFRKGQQAMLNVLNKGDLEDALVHPEKYPDLIVRVGGFAARFVELDPDVQREIVSRTLYGNDN